MSVDKYEYVIRWYEPDRAWLGTVVEIPGLSWLADNMEEALRGIHDVAAVAVEDMLEMGEVPPEPARSWFRNGLLKSQQDRENLFAVTPIVHDGASVQRAVEEALSSLAALADKSPGRRGFVEPVHFVSDSASKSLLEEPQVVSHRQSGLALA